MNPAAATVMAFANYASTSALNLQPASLKSDSKPGPWLKNRPENTRWWRPILQGGMMIQKSGAIYEPRTTGWRRRRDLERRRAANKAKA